MSKKIYVGNLPFSATESDIESLFAQHGEVVSVKLITDRETGRSRGFAFVEMEEEGAEAAMRELAEHEMDGRPLRVNEARERRPRGGQRGGPRRRE
jgi:RNA recognition motif-containing protein